MSGQLSGGRAEHLLVAVQTRLGLGLSRLGIRANLLVQSVNQSVS